MLHGIEKNPIYEMVAYKMRFKDSTISPMKQPTQETSTQKSIDGDEYISSTKENPPPKKVEDIKSMVNDGTYLSDQIIDNVAGTIADMFLK